MIKTVDNYFTTQYEDTDRYYFKFDDRKTYADREKKFIGDKFEVRLKDYRSKTLANTFFSFFVDEYKKTSDDLILSILKQKDRENEEFYVSEVGNYVGKFVWYGLEVDIKSRFSNRFLERMLNFANDIFLDDISVFGKEAKNLDFSKYIIYYMFIQNFEKAFLLGLPKAYRSVNHHEMKLKGKIDINKFIKYDIPFQGKISSISREQKEIQEIIDTLHKAVKIIDKSGSRFTKNILHIKTHLKQNRSNNYVSNKTVNKALNSKALQNPIFSAYKNVLEYARFIINGSNLEESNKKEKNKTYGFLVNVAELFEIYVTKLLQKEFSDWHISSPKIELYENQFFARKIIPDIVMIKGRDVLIFDTKYKRMLMRNRYMYGGDVDRCDFFQINSYMSYYQNQDYNVIAGGLLYPMEVDFDNNEEKQKEAHSDTWFGNKVTKFIVDGIDLTDLEEADNDENIFDPIKRREEVFIARIKKIIKDRGITVE